MSAKRKIVISPEDISAIRVFCQECQKTSLHTPYSEPPTCQHAKLHPEDHGLQACLLLLNPSALSSALFRLELEVDE
jgi:hypothetical protein